MGKLEQMKLLDFSRFCRSRHQIYKTIISDLAENFKACCPFHLPFFGEKFYRKPFLFMPLGRLKSKQDLLEIGQAEESLPNSKYERLSLLNALFWFGHGMPHCLEGKIKVQMFSGFGIFSNKFQLVECSV